MQIRSLFLAGLACAAATPSSAASPEGLAPEWTNTSPADATLMGDYEGEWIDAPKGHYFNINKPLAAQVISLRDGEYALRFFQEHDRRADTYFEGNGKLEGGVIKFSANGWTGEIGPDGLTGTGAGQGKDSVRFALKRVARLSPTLGAKPPAGAKILFDGKNMDAWQHGDGRPVTWNVIDGGILEVRSARSDEDKKNRIGGDIETKEKFGDCQIHLEFRYPVESGKAGQGRGNSGFFFQRDYEVQILNSYGLAGNWNECGALYKLAPPKVNAARPPLVWQTYDIDYKASVWQDGKKVSNPRITVRLNGVLVHNDEEIIHVTSHTFAGRFNEPKGPGPIRLQDHHHPIQFRNIWMAPTGKP